jgi:hypothetical protein
MVTAKICMKTFQKRPLDKDAHTPIDLVVVRELITTFLLRTKLSVVQPSLLDLEVGQRSVLGLLESSRYCYLPVQGLEWKASWNINLDSYINKL